MREETTRLATIVSATASGEGSVVSTQSIDAGEARGNPTSTEGRARLFLNVTALTGSLTPTMLVSIVHVIDAVDIEVGAFTITSGTGAQVETIVIEACPRDLKVKYVAGGTVTDFDATVDCMRF